MTDNYDLTNLDDLPEELKNQLKKKSTNIDDEKIMKLFQEKTSLTLDEILVALFRKYKMVKKRTWVSNRLFALSKARKIKKMKKGLYEKI